MPPMVVVEAEAYLLLLGEGAVEEENPHLHHISLRMIGRKRIVFVYALTSQLPADCR
jgi:hypothetical protein